MDYILHHPSREGLCELQRPVVDERLEEIGLIPTAVKIPPPRLVEFQVVPDRRPHLIRNRQSALAAALDPKPDDPAPVAPVEIRDLERADLGDAKPEPQPGAPLDLLNQPWFGRLGQDVSAGREREVQALLSGPSPPGSSSEACLSLCPSMIQSVPL